MLDDYLAKFTEKAKACHEIHLVGPLIGLAPDYAGPVNYPGPILYVDGGADFRYGEQGLAVGDGDSAQSPMDVKLNYSKDYSDLSFVLNYIPAAFKKIHLHGFLGGRRDHELMNFAEIHRFLIGRNLTQARFADEVLACSAGVYQLPIQGLFSLFLFAETTVELTGDCAYHVQKAQQIIPLSSHGLSNTGRGQVKLKCNGPLFIFFTHGL